MNAAYPVSATSASETRPPPSSSPPTPSSNPPTPPTWTPTPTPKTTPSPSSDPTGLHLLNNLQATDNSPQSDRTDGGSGGWYCGCGGGTANASDAAPDFGTPTAPYTNAPNGASYDTGNAGNSSQPAHRNSSGNATGGTYNASECIRTGLTCTNPNIKKGAQQSSGFNPFHWIVQGADWIGHQFRAHWRGIVQTAVFVGCLSVAWEVCVGSELLGIGADYIGNGLQYGFGSKQALSAAGKSILIDAVTFMPGLVASSNLDGLIFRGGKLVPTDDLRGFARFFGEYRGYTPSHASGLVGYHQGAIDFMMHPVADALAVLGRAGMNEISCNGGDVMGYC